MSCSQSSPGYYNTLPSTSTTTTAAHSVFAMRCPWRELAQPFSSFTRPYTLGEATAHVKCNLDHFCMNYAFIALLILFLSLHWHPISMIVFLAMTPSSPKKKTPAKKADKRMKMDPNLFSLLFHITVDDRIILALLSIITIVALVLTDVWLNVLILLTLG
ncbi:PRA1 family protein F3-like [Quercus robur]|uniref:PRA1 family protein F3-like n=1 Tax=Quercus robur TaxID=38942 RepID=UPI0021635426|nr:PRA1 family protein F3-like [Quercus robur]